MAEVQTEYFSNHVLHRTVFQPAVPASVACPTPSRHEAVVHFSTRELALVGILGLAGHGLFQPEPGDYLPVSPAAIEASLHVGAADAPSSFKLADEMERHWAGAIALIRQQGEDPETMIAEAGTVLSLWKDHGGVPYSDDGLEDEV